MEEIGRRRPVHGVHIDIGSPTIVFLTVCTKGRERWLACREAHESLLAAWGEADSWRVGRYVLMPDHVHLFCAPVDLNFSLEAWVRFWKSRFTKNFSRPGMECRWQSHHWDRRLRREESYAEKWAYVCENPVRAGLVKVTDEWPFQGELHYLRW